MRVSTLLTRMRVSACFVPLAKFLPLFNRRTLIRR
jgi:hypothetical protein